MSAILSVGQVGLKIRQNMAFRYLKLSNTSPLVSPTHIFGKRKNISRPFSAVIIPVHRHENRQDVPSQEVLSRLRISDLCRDIPNDDTDGNSKPIDSSFEAQRREAEMAEETAEEREQKEARKRDKEAQKRDKEARKRDKDSASGDQAPVADLGSGGQGRTTEDQSEHESHSGEGGDIGTGGEGGDIGFGDVGFSDNRSVPYYSRGMTKGMRAALGTGWWL